MTIKQLSMLLIALLTSIHVEAQTLNVKAGNVTYRYPAELTGVMTYTNGDTLSILGKDYIIGNIDEATVADSPPSVNTVIVAYSDTAQSITVATEQWAGLETIDSRESNRSLFNSAISGLRLNFQMTGVTHVEVESVDGYAIAGTAMIHHGGDSTAFGIIDKQSIITYHAAEGSTMEPGTDYVVTIFPCDLYGGYRLSIFRDGLVAHYFGVHQRSEAGSFICPNDLDESELDFADPAEPFTEDERPWLNKATREALMAYKRNPTEENKAALLEQMGIRYDKVVARKKAKLRQLEREAMHQALIDEMQAIVDEMIENRDMRIYQQFLRLIDPREDDNPDDEWLVLRGTSANNAYIAYAPVTNAEYAQFKESFTYAIGQENYPVVNISYWEALAYCQWLSLQDTAHDYRLPSEEEWVLAAGHMPKDVVMNSNFVEEGLTAVDAYAQTTGACGGIDFWGNCWEWTSTTNDEGLYIVKGGSWDSSRDACRTEYSGDARDPESGYDNVGFRVVRVDL